MENLDEKTLEVAEEYAEQLVKLKLTKRTSVGCLIAAGILGVGGIALLANISALSFILGPIVLAAPITLAIVSLVGKIFGEKIYKDIADNCNISKKELKKLLKSNEMKKCLQHIFSKDYNPGVEQIAKLSDTLNGRNPNYKSSIPIIESIRKEIYGKDAKEQKKNSNKR